MCSLNYCYENNSFKHSVNSSIFCVVAESSSMAEDCSSVMRSVLSAFLIVYLTSSVICVFNCSICRVVCFVCSERVRISFATIEILLPALPRRAVSIDAFRSINFVLSAIPVIDFKTSDISDVVSALCLVR